ncbi:hypothetical protein, partial [Litorimonas sp.]|uniref:hypothetical protein n=1 Tax=Litorimonas sp. TaxID=1892381 RepID=UPI003A8AD2E2
AVLSELEILLGFGKRSVLFQWGKVFFGKLERTRRMRTGIDPPALSQLEVIPAVHTRLTSITAASTVSVALAQLTPQALPHLGLARLQSLSQLTAVAAIMAVWW